MDDVDRAILDVIQTDFPIAERPYDELGRMVGAEPDEAHRRVRELLRKRVLRRLGPVFDSRRLGFKSTLAAIEVEPDRVEEAARVIDEYPEITHNYERRCRYNVWFTVIAESRERVTDIVEDVARRAGALRHMELPATKVFKINVRFPVAGGATRPKAPARRPAGEPAITALTRRVVAETSAGMSDSPEPYAELARRLGVETYEVVAEFRRLKKEGALRKMGAIADQRRLGMGGNIMGVWDVGDADLEKAGPSVAARPEVTHCYARPPGPDWPYNLYGMVHMDSAEACRRLVADLARDIGAERFDCLETVRELKKTPPVYFGGPQP